MAKPVWLIERWVNGGWVKVGEMYSEITANLAVKSLNDLDFHWQYRARLING